MNYVKLESIRTLLKNYYLVINILSLQEIGGHYTNSLGLYKKVAQK